jgi:glycyl-tRNA synthetase
MLRAAGFSTDVDESGSIGRRYARQDEVGTPWCITIDDVTMRDDTVTVRDRDTTQQRRVAINSLSSELSARVR